MVVAVGMPAIAAKEIVGFGESASALGSSSSESVSGCSTI
jgi:hypothetical protein